MRSYDAASAAYIAARTGVVARILFHLSARNRDTGLIESVGFWNGDDDKDFTIEGNVRTYYGAGELLSFPTMQAIVGLEKRMHEIGVSPYGPKIKLALKVYDPRLAPIELHRALLDPVSGLLVAEPHRLIRGRIEEVRFPRPAKGQSASASIVVSTESAKLTRSRTQKKSDESQKLRGGDGIRRYADVTGRVGVWWGRKRKNRRGKN